MVSLEEALTRWVGEIYPDRNTFVEALGRKKLRIYHGVDPTGTDLHLGHSTNYLLLKALQEAGHEIILLIGDFTARIGDPSDKTAARIRLSPSEIRKNFATYKEQVSKIIKFAGKNAAQVKFNSAWLSRLTFKDVIELAAEFTVQQVIERDTFQKRLKESKPLYLHEFLYPLAQGYDSVAMNVDVEVGGTDQTFNMLVGRTLVKSHLGKEKFAVTTPLLVNPKTGEKLMSKSSGNYIALNDLPQDMFGKVMALSDETMIPVFKLCTEIPLSQVQEFEKRMRENPMEVKKELASEIVRTYYGDAQANQAREEFENVVQKKLLPQDTPEIEPDQLFKDISSRHGVPSSGATTITQAVAAGANISTSEAIRRIAGGTVSVDDVKTINPRDQFDIYSPKDRVLKVGGRKYIKVKKGLPKKKR